jgi:hypothetical protein
MTRWLLLLVVHSRLLAAGIELMPCVPSSFAYEYEFVDGGPSLVPIELLSRNHFPDTMAPRVNAARKVPYYLGDNYGDIHFRDTTQASIAVGCFKTAGPWRPLIWTKKEGLHHLGYYLGWDIHGVALGVNNHGTLIGGEFDFGPLVPFVWNPTWGLLRLEHFKSRLNQAKLCLHLGNVHFADLLIGDDNMVYGTFCMEERGKRISPYMAFRWDPPSDQLRWLDLKGMRINAIAASKTVVGRYQGLAALCDIGRTPVLLVDLIPDVAAEWEFIDATDISSKGDIVGYGKKNGHIRTFALKRGKLKRNSLSHTYRKEGP